MDAAEGPAPALPPTSERLGVGLLLALTLAVFLPALGADFVFDDQNLIVQNTLTGSLANLPQMFQVSLWSTCPAGDGDAGMYYRPLMLVSLAVDRALFGLSPAGAHLHSLGWHLLAILLLHRLLRVRLALPSAPALLGAGLFALHPAQVESLLFVSARNDLMAAVGVLAALLVLTPGDPPPSWRRLLVGAGAMLLATLSKESAVLAPFLLLAVEQARARQRGAPRAHAALLVGLGVALGLRVLAGVGAPTQAQPERLLAVLLPSAGRYAQILLWPRDLVPGFHVLYFPAVPWTALLALVLLLALALARSPQPQLARMGIVWAIVAAAPALPAIAHTAVVPDRYLYLPLAGIGLIAAAMGCALPPPLGRAAAVGLALILASLSAQTLPTWQEDAVLWTRTAQVMPSPYASGGLAKILELRGDLDGAAEHYARAVVPPHPYPHSCWNLSAIHLKRGDPLAAGQAAQIGLAAGCEPSAELLAPAALGMALAGQWEQALHLANQVERDPTGKAILVRLAAAARHGDLQPLQDAARAAEGGLGRLAPMVAAVLEQGQEPAAAAQVRTLIP